MKRRQFLGTSALAAVAAGIPGGAARAEGRSSGLFRSGMAADLHRPRATPPEAAPWEAAPRPPSVSVPRIVAVRPGAIEAHIPVTASGPIHFTAWVRATRLINVPMGGFNVGSDHSAWLPPFDLYWRDGDEPTHWVTIRIEAPEAMRQRPGSRFGVLFEIHGWSNDRLETIVEVQNGALNAMPETYPRHRPPLMIDFSAARPAVDLDITSMRWSDTGYVDNAPVISGSLNPQDPASTPCWRARLFHGYEQVGNGELGAYLNEYAFPNDAVEPLSIRVDSHGRPFVRMHSRRLAKPVTIGSNTYNFQAAVLNSQAMDEWCARTGVYRAQILLPSRVGAWTAFWTCGRQKDVRGGRWPPEIDFFEHFNGAFGLADWPMNGSTTTAGQHTGPYGSNNRTRVDGRTTNLWRLGHDTGVNLYTEIHDYACLVTEDRIYHFIDGIETISMPNMARHEDPANEEWNYMIYITNSVKPPEGPGGAYADGSGDLLIYGLQRYDLDSGYVLADWTEPRPWPNRKVMPDPDPA
jgi:hypothetical protein